ncbi:MAG: hypothetical protein Q8S09_00395 [Hyphomonas sp.]|nr:hypothetical protein [Hyphomonas sp.]
MTRTKAQKARERALEVRRIVNDKLADVVICERCGATGRTYGEVCSAALDDWCDGFDRFEREEQAAAAQLDGVIHDARPEDKP